MDLKRRAKEAITGTKAEQSPEYLEFVEGLPKYEYRWLTGTALAGWFSGKPDPKKVEAKINGLAAEGWRVITISFSGQVKEFLALDANHICIVLERPAGAPPRAESKPSLAERVKGDPWKGGARTTPLN